MIRNARLWAQKKGIRRRERLGSDLKKFLTVNCKIVDERDKLKFK